MALAELGIIEGFYGRPWSWEARAETAAFLGPRGYGFYLYAPKGDAYLRRRWKEDHPPDVADRLRTLRRRCEEAGLRFGVGLSPFEIWQEPEAEARDALGRKLEFLDELGVRDLALLFDDMRGDDPELATKQIRIVEWAAGRTAASRIMVCPTYYTDDPVLDRVFGARPPDYLEELGRGLDPAIHLFWTGEEVVSRELSTAHLEAVTERLGRKPFLWDNYPVNDGQRMSQYLHLRAFSGRRAAIREHIAAHGINAALQPTLTRIPALTLADVYRLGDRYAYGAAFRHAAEVVLGPELGAMVRDDLLTLQDVGLDRLGEREAALRERYGSADHPAAREIVEWLDGGYRITDEVVQTQ